MKIFSDINSLHNNGLLKKIDSGNKPKFITDDSVNYLALTGSHAYGGATPESDYDFYGIVTPPVTEVFPHIKGEIQGFGKQNNRFEQWELQHTQSRLGETDITIYNIVKYFQLTMDCNPNMIHSLFVPDHCVYHVDNVGKMIRKNKYLFLSEKAYHTFRGIAFAHMRKIEGKQRQAGSRRANIIEKYGYDTKDASYIIRFILELKEIMFEGDLHIDRHGQKIIDIRNGKYSLDEILKEYHETLDEIENHRDKSVIPYSPDEKKIQDLLVKCLEESYGSLNKFGYNNL